MGKQGPCYHCGITTTPLWRNGPPDKPVLCNACGSRWRTKGTLLNYMPMHSGGFGVDPDKWGRSKNSIRPSDKVSRKRKEPSDGNSETGLSKAGTYFSTSVEEDGSTRSSWGSEISTFDGPMSKAIHSGSAFLVRGTPWETPVPSRKRTNMFRSRASSERITRKLISLEEQEVSSVTCPSSDTVLAETKSPLVAVEIGLGSVFIRQPAQTAQEPESEASSLLIDNKGYDHVEVRSQGESRRMAPHWQVASSKPLSSRGKEKVKQAPKRPEVGRVHLDKHYNSNKALLENFPYNKRDVLQSMQSPLVFLEMKDIVNFDTFTGLLTDQEQLQLMKLLSSVDVSQSPESLKSMFSSAQFDGALSNFQQLLSEGMFDSSELGLNPRVLHHFQQLLTVTDLTTSGWMERCSQLQTRSKRRAEVGGKDKFKGVCFPGNATPLSAEVPEIEYASGKHLAPLLERSGNSKSHTFHGNTQVSMPQSAQLPRDISSLKLTHPLKAPKPESGSSSHKVAANEGRAKEVPRFSNTNPSAFAQKQQASSAARNSSLSLMEEGHDSGGELDLLYVPSSMSFHQAELLHQPAWTKSSGEESGDMGNGDLIISNTWHMDNTADWDGLIWNPSSGGRGRVLPNGTVLNP